jgi:hypothetical protein
VIGLSKRAQISRKQRNLVNVKFNLLNWILDTSSIVLVLVSSEYFQIVYLLVISIGHPLLYMMGMEQNRKDTQNYFKSRIGVFQRPGTISINYMSLQLKPMADAIVMPADSY